MSNYIEYRDSITFHPGYYLKEIVEELGITQDEFAKRLGTTPKTLSKLINGKQGLSADIALRLSRMLETSAGFWLDLQAIYDVAEAEKKAGVDLREKRHVLNELGY